MSTTARLVRFALVLPAFVLGCRDAPLRPLEKEPPELLLSWGDFGSGEGAFFQPIDVARAPDGSLFVTDAQNHRIQKFTPQGEFLAAIGQGQTAYPSAVAVGADGRVYVSDQTVRIHVFASDGTYERYLDYAAADAGLAVSGDGSLLVVGYKVLLRVPSLVLVGPRVWRVSPDGAETASWEGPDDGLTSAWFPTGIAEDQSGRVYVAGSRRHREGGVEVKTGEFVWVFRHNGELITRFGLEGADASRVRFEGVAVDSRGSIYVADWHGGSGGGVYRFSRGGDPVLYWRSAGDGTALQSPVGLLTDPVDRLYVVDWALNAVYKFSYN